MTRPGAVLVLAAAVAAAGWGANLGAVKNEPNLERRSERALENANKAITEAREFYNANEVEKAKAALQELVESVELSEKSLAGTGKKPRSSPKYFKRAEMSVREMLRRLKSLEPDFGVDDRPMVVGAEERLQAVHDQLIDGLMGARKK